MAEMIKVSEQVERIRQAVLRHGGNVTIGDIMSATGLGADEAKAGLDSLIVTHEGTMRVSEKGELMYSFSNGCILRDQRSWWERNKKTVLKVVKVIFKIIIMLVLVIYFIIYLIILLALLSSDRNRSSGPDFSGIWFVFWGTGNTDSRFNAGGYRKDPLYTRVYNFVFGPEEEEIDPLEARTKCAQLIRAKNGVITVEDWIMISGQPRSKCESDLARFTAEFNGSAEITDNGTLVYVFEDLMMSSNKSGKESLPDCAWMTLEQPRRLSGNSEQNGGNLAVIGLNTFNLIMSFVCMYALRALLTEDLDSVYGLSEIDRMRLAQQNAQIESISFWIGIFPFIFSSLIFLVPLLRLPSNIKENRARRERSVHKAALKSILDNRTYDGKPLTLSSIAKEANTCLHQHALPSATKEELKAAVNEIAMELDGEYDGSSYTFPRMDERLADAGNERAVRALDKKAMGRVVYSTNNQEQERLDEENERCELDEFDRLICKAPNAKEERAYSQDERPYSIDSGDILSGLSSIDDSYNQQYSSQSTNLRNKRGQQN